MWLSTNFFILVIFYAVWTRGVGELFLFAMFWFFITVPKSVKVVYFKVVKSQKWLSQWVGEFWLSFSLNLIKSVKQRFETLSIYLLLVWNISSIQVRTL